MLEAACYKPGADLGVRGLKGRRGRASLGAWTRAWIRIGDKRLKMRLIGGSLTSVRKRKGDGGTGGHTWLRRRDGPVARGRVGRGQVGLIGKVELRGRKRETKERGRGWANKWVAKC